MKLGMVFLMVGMGLCGSAQAETVDEILGSVDTNLNFESRYTKATMTVQKPRRSKSYTLETWSQGMGTAATEFHSPRRDAGTKMLKKGGELWMYMPAIEKVQRISGHMLRQGMMGSDLSYEDLLEFSAWQEMYTAVNDGDEACGEHTCWVLTMTAKGPDVSYPKRKVWVDQTTRVPVRQELFALSGMLLKTWTMESPQQFGERWYPTRMVLEDKLQDDTSTTLEFTDLNFGEGLDSSVFEMRWLER
jgi:outer membrane lipoprotein-sorting protein